MADLGCGTGILPIVISECGGFNGKIYAFDSETNCIEATKMNSQIFGLAENTKTIEIDLVDIYKPKGEHFGENQIEFYKSVTNELE